MDAEIGRSCACGATYTYADWLALPGAKVYRVEAENGGRVEVYEQRRCRCGSHIVCLVPPELLEGGEHVGADASRDPDRAAEVVRVEVKAGRVVIERAGEAFDLPPGAAEHLGATLTRAARLARQEVQLAQLAALTPDDGAPLDGGRTLCRMPMARQGFRKGSPR